MTLEKPLNQATVDTKDVLCQKTPPVVEGKTLQGNDKNAELAAADGETLPEHPVIHVVLKVNERHDGMKNLSGSSRRDRVSTKSAKEDEELVRETSSQRKALLIENNFDCCSQKKLQVQEPIAEDVIDRQMANGKLDGRRESIAETAALILAHSNHADLKKLFSDGKSVRGYLKTKPDFTEQCTKVKDPYRQMAKNVVQDVFARIGCYESFVRRASWADEPSSGPRNLETILMAYSFTDPYGKVQLSLKQNLNFYLLTTLLIQKR